MLIKTFWTNKRLEVLSKTSLTLFQAFLIAGVLGGIFDKITSMGLKIAFVIATLLFFGIGLMFSDWPLKKEG